MPEETAPAQAADATPAPAAAAPAVDAPPPLPQGTRDTDFQARAVAALKAANAASTETPAEAPPQAPAPVETPAPAAPPPPEAPKQPALHEQFAALKAEERRVRQMREAAKAEERAEREALLREQQEFRQLKAAKESADPIAALQALGFTYEQATEQMLGKYTPKSRAPEKSPEAQRLEAVEAELQQLRQEKYAATEKAAIADYRANLLQHAQAHKDKYEYAAADPELIDEALQWTMEYARRNGVIPGETMEQAFDEALAHVESRHDKRLERVLTSSKLKARLAPATPSQQQAGPKTAAARNLNSLAAGSAPPPAQTKPLRDEDYLANAMKVLRGG